MKTIHHLCQGGTAASLLRAALDAPVIDILDDAAIGPLADVDTGKPDARVRFMKALFASGGFDAQEYDAMDWYGELRDMNQRLASLSQNASEMVIWAEQADTEQALRRRAHWWLRDAALPVSEVDVSLRGLVKAQVQEVVAKRVQANTDLRAQLAAEWTALAQQGDAVRVWDNGVLKSYPIDHHDAAYLALVSSQPVQLASADVLGAAMSQSRRSDLFCKWRFSVLIEQGKIAVAQGDARDLSSVFVAAK